MHWLYERSHYSVVKTLGVDVIVTSHTTSTFNMADVNVKESVSLMVTPKLKSNARDQNLCKKKKLSWLFGADRKIHPSGSLFGITRHSRMPNSDPRIDFSIRTSHPWKLLIFLHTWQEFLRHWHVQGNVILHQGCKMILKHDVRTSYCCFEVSIWSLWKSDMYAFIRKRY